MTNLKTKGVVAVAVLLGFAVFFVSFFTASPMSSAEQDNSAKEFIVNQGEAFDSIADNLKKEGLIKSKTVFKMYSFLTGRMESLKAGKYFLDGGFSLTEIARLLADGPKVASIMIFPGETLKEIDDKLSENSVIRAGDLIHFNPRLVLSDYPWLKGANSLEGFLLPDTYNFSEHSDAKTAIRKMLDNFEKKAVPFLEKSPEGFSNTLILASILEKEIPNFEEQKIAAGIFNKRMKTGMALQADATVIYAKCSGRFFGCAPLTRLDFQKDSPYNTYLYAGLPPAPISNPSAKTIEAASKAEKSDYWYYLSDPKTKKTIFGKTLEEHNENRALYLLRK
jgi:UPF0755 protein